MTRHPWRNDTRHPCHGLLVPPLAASGSGSVVWPLSRELRLCNTKRQGQVLGALSASHVWQLLYVEVDWSTQCLRLPPLTVCAR